MSKNKSPWRHFTSEQLLSMAVAFTFAGALLERTSLAHNDDKSEAARVKHIATFKELLESMNADPKVREQVSADEF